MVNFVILLTILAINQRNSETYFKQNNIDLLVIDEAQNIPDIGKKLKLMVDEIEGLSKMHSKHMLILNQDSFTGHILK